MGGRGRGEGPGAPWCATLQRAVVSELPRCWGPGFEREGHESPGGPRGAAHTGRVATYKPGHITSSEAGALQAGSGLAGRGASAEPSALHLGQFLGVGVLGRPRRSGAPSPSDPEASHSGTWKRAGGERAPGCPASRLRSARAHTHSRARPPRPAGAPAAPADGRGPARALSLRSGPGAPSAPAEAPAPRHPRRHPCRQSTYLSTTTRPRCPAGTARRTDSGPGLLPFSFRPRPAR